MSKKLAWFLKILRRVPKNPCNTYGRIRGKKQAFLGPNLVQKEIRPARSAGLKLLKLNHKKPHRVLAQVLSGVALCR